MAKPRTCAARGRGVGRWVPAQRLRGFGAQPHVRYGAHVRAREGAVRGVGAPASDRAGVWGGAPRKLR